MLNSHLYLKFMYPKIHTVGRGVPLYSLCGIIKYSKVSTNI